MSIAAWFGVGIGVAATIGLLGKSKRKNKRVLLRNEETPFYYNRLQELKLKLLFLAAFLIELMGRLV
ncbi:hypothetical protein [Neobacillus terrae]|uniref:hypothetical protein n=1 Tax=Neobacillus terrae TaxID=3034837 RepID=UPI00140E95B6|nr:hypothetical protein [Neobacillus terrae]NHM33420.1 hypothetical protein [Neobacillus terrae]